MTNYTSKTRRNRHIVSALIAFVVTAVAVFGIFSVFNAVLWSSVQKDSGIAACEDMAKRASDSASGEKTTETMTEAQYKDARAPFENSKYPELKIAGMNMVDTIKDASDTLNKNDADLATAMLVLTNLKTDWAALQTACAAHGVTLPQLDTN